MHRGWALQVRGMYRGQTLQVRGMYRGQTLQVRGMYRGQTLHVRNVQGTDSCLQVGDNTDGHYITWFAEQLTEPSKYLFNPFTLVVIRKQKTEMKMNLMFTC